MITVVSLNPCIDETLVCETFEAGKTNRFAPGMMDAGGKGFNVAMALRALGSPCRLIGLLPETNSALYAESVKKSGLENDFVSCAGALRVNTKIMDGKGVLTEINRAGFSADGSVVRRITEQCVYYAGKSDLMVFSGSMPSGFPDDFYAWAAGNLSCPVMIDASGKALTHAAHAPAVLIKPNWEEFCALTGLSLDASAEEALAAARKTLCDGAENAAVSLGGDGMMLIGRKVYERIKAPRVPVRSTVGAGDNALAAMAAAWVRGKRGRALLCCGVAAGSASVMQAGTKPLDRSDYEALLERCSEAR